MPDDLEKWFTEEWPSLRLKLQYDKAGKDCPKCGAEKSVYIIVLLGVRICCKCDQVLDEDRVWGIP